jgi:hypothetical protein
MLKFVKSTQIWLSKGFKRVIMVTQGVLKNKPKNCVSQLLERTKAKQEQVFTSEFKKRYDK